MGETAENVKSHIDEQRAELTENVDELEGRMKEFTDWEHQFQEHPLLLMGVAFGGGFLLSSLLTGSGNKEDGVQRRYQPYFYEPAYRSGQQHAERGNGEVDDSPGFRAWATGERGPSASTQAGKERAASKIDEVRGALLGLAATRLEEFLKEALPGFESEVNKVQEKRNSQGVQDEQSIPGTDRFQAEGSERSGTAARG